MASNFEEEILEWTLEQGSVQGLLKDGVNKWSLTEADALKVILDFASEDLLTFYEYTPDNQGFVDIAVDKISLDYLASRPYTWLAVTEKSVKTLDQMYKKSKQID
jgi:hypothetical protein